MTKITRGKPQALSSSFLACLIVSIIIQSSFTSFSTKICRLTDFDINFKNIRVIIIVI